MKFKKIFEGVFWKPDKNPANDNKKYRKFDEKIYFDRDSIRGKGDK